jgi:large subunit ribosomal protein L24
MRKIKKGDNVVVIAGRDKGKRGDVARVLAEHLLVTGINQVKKHQRPNPMKGEQGGIVSKEMPIHVSNVALWCNKCGATRIGYRFADDGKKIRVCRRCGGDI